MIESESLLNETKNSFLDFIQQLDQLLSLSEELQDENEKFREQLRSSQCQIQTLLLDKQKLSEQVRKQMLQIQQQGEQIVMLLNSDVLRIREGKNPNGFILGSSVK